MWLRVISLVRFIVRRILDYSCHQNSLRSRRSESGIAVVEFAFVLPLLFILLLGVLFISQGFNLQMVLYGAASEGARIWASNPFGGNNVNCTPPACNPDQPGRVNFQQYVIPAVRQYISSNGFDGNAVKFFTRNDAGFITALNAAGNNTQMVRVTLLYPVNLPVGSFSGDFNTVWVTATCVMRRGS
ncbi:MAG TPA: TadE/TadG family type IV pilus assembly protein [Blastocatellia bacterium]|nr:TadE/TadG family type IV pilus assembly protein [Blastocatellia bacterium]